MGTLLKDLRYSARLLVTSPTYAGIVALTLSIGANTVIVSIASVILIAKCRGSIGHLGLGGVFIRVWT